MDVRDDDGQYLSSAGERIGDGPCEGGLRFRGRARDPAARAGVIRIEEPVIVPFDRLRCPRQQEEQTEYGERASECATSANHV